MLEDINSSNDNKGNRKVIHCPEKLPFGFAAPSTGGNGEIMLADFLFLVLEFSLQLS